MTTSYRIISPTAEMRGAPDAKALRGKYESQLVFGEEFMVEAIENGWAKGRSAHDNYAGYVEEKFISRELMPKPTHIVTAAHSLAYAEATIKSPLLQSYSFGSLISVTRMGDKFAQLADGSWIYIKHLSAVTDKEEDYVETAQKFLDTPYQWGGRSGFGIDCSGLVQVSLARAGYRAGRDTEDQIALGEETPRARRGDLVFFPGHVGIMIDEDNIIHANAFHMKVTIEPLWKVETRSEGITAMRRLG